MTHNTIILTYHLHECPAHGLFFVLSCLQRHVPDLIKTRQEKHVMPAHTPKQQSLLRARGQALEAARMKESKVNVLTFDDLKPISFFVSRTGITSDMTIQNDAFLGALLAFFLTTDYGPYVVRFFRRESRAFCRVALAFEDREEVTCELTVTKAPPVLQALACIALAVLKACRDERFVFALRGAW